MGSTGEERPATAWTGVGGTVIIRRQPNAPASRSARTIDALRTHRQRISTPSPDDYDVVILARFYSCCQESALVAVNRDSSLVQAANNDRACGSGAFRDAVASGRHPSWPFSYSVTAPAGSRAETMLSAASWLGAWPVTAAMKSSRSRA
jgi:hypothetical protein